MRTLILGLATALAFTGAAGCKKSQTEKSATELKKAQEKVDDRRDDVIDQQKDVAKEQRDVDKARQDLAQAEGNLAAKRSQFQASTTEKLAVIDAKIAALDSKILPDSSAKDKERVAELKNRRREVSAKLDLARDRTATNWDDFTKEVGTDMEKLDKDLDDTLK